MRYTIKEHFEYKKESCLERGIDWGFTLEEFTIFWSLRSDLKCFYTGQAFNLVKNKGKLPKDYPTMERLSPSSPYSPDSVVWITHESNQLKAKFIEQGNNRKNQTPTTLGVINKIEKVLNNPKALATKFQVYKEAYKELEQEKTTLAEENLKAMQAQQEKKKAEEEKAALQDKFFQEVLFSDYYSRIAKSFMEKSLLCQITIGDMKKMVVRCNRDMITCDVFDSLDDKHLWVVDKSLPVTKENVKVVKESTKIALDSLISEGNLAKVALSLHKLTVK